MMHGREKSDPAIVAMKPTNKAGNRRRSRWSQGRGPRGMRTSKARAGRRTGKACHRRWTAYGKLQGKGRRSGSPRSSTTSDSTCCGWRSRAQAGCRAWRGRADVAGLRGRPRRETSRICTNGSIGERTGRCRHGGRYIPKPDGRQRPLAIAALEDKIVQRATVAVLNAIYEEDFLGFSYGFRPGRSQHDALDALVVGISSTKVNWILDADIRPGSSTRSAKSGWSASWSTGSATRASSA